MVDKPFIQKTNWSADHNLKKFNIKTKLRDQFKMNIPDKNHVITVTFYI